MQVTKTALIFVGLGVLLGPSRAEAQCAAPYYTWGGQTVSTAAGQAWAPTSDSAYNTTGGNYSYIAQGNKLLAVRNTADAGGAAGTVKWTWTDPSGTITNFPSPVPLKAGGEYIFLVSSDGFLYKINAADGTVPIAPVDTRRVGCAAGGAPPDSAIATPTVQLWNNSSCTFKNSVDGVASGCGAATCGSGGPHACNDVVYVITRTGCSDSTSNRVIAYYSNDLAVKWTFNGAATRKMDFGTEGCALDYTTDTLFCGTNNDPLAATPQNSLWAINSVTGAYKWAGNAGPIRNRPQLALGKLWVGTYNGDVMTYNPAGSGTGLLAAWPGPVHVPGFITNNIWPEFRSGTGQGNVYLRDSTNNLYVIGPRPDASIGILYSTTGGNYTSMPVVLPSQGKVYVGTSSGYIQQLAQVGLGLQDKALINNTATVYDATLDVESAADVNRLVVAAAGVSGGAGKVSRVCLPLSNTGSGGAATCAQDANCAGHLVDGSICNPCDPCFCDNDPIIGSFTCYHDRSRAIPEGGSCSDGLDCTCSASHADGAGNCTSTGANDVCRSFVCTSDYFKTCACVNPGDRACAPGLTCCGSTNGGCVNLQTDIHHCGGCGIDCGNGGNCQNGNCHQANPCTAPTASQLNSIGVPSGTAVAFDASGSTCYAYVSTYATGVVNSIYKIFPSPLSSTAYNSPSGNFTPLNGVAVTRQGDMVFGSYVNDGTLSFVPGLAWEQSTGAPSNLQKPVNASNTTSAAPWTNGLLDDGPVGPAFDYVSYTPGTANSAQLYFGNFTTSGTITKLTYGSGTSWSSAGLTTFTNPSGERITAIAFERRWNKTVSPRTKDRTLFIGHGKTLVLYNLDKNTQIEVDLDAKLIRAHSEGTISGILSIAVHPLFGDIYVEVRDTAGVQYVIDVDDNDLSARNFNDVQVDQHAGSGFPTSFANQGKLVMTPSQDLMRMVPAVNGAANFTTYGATAP